MKEVFLGIGTNLGDRESNLRESLLMVGQQIGKVADSSPVYETEPWGFESDSNFLNIVVKVLTSLSPQELLEKTGFIERTLGRIRNESRYSSRVIDIDILFYENEIVNEINLKVPHPKIESRMFVLVPLNDIAPDLIHPLYLKTVSSLLDACHDTSTVNYKSVLEIRQP